MNTEFRFNTSADELLESGEPTSTAATAQGGHGLALPGSHPTAAVKNLPLSWSMPLLHHWMQERLMAQGSGRPRALRCAQTCATAQWSQADEDEPQVRDCHIASTGSALAAIGIGALPCGLWYLPLYHCNYWRAACPLGQTLSRGVPLQTPQNRAMAQMKTQGRVHLSQNRRLCICCAGSCRPVLAFVGLGAFLFDDPLKQHRMLLLKGFAPSCQRLGF